MSRLVCAVLGIAILSATAGAQEAAAEPEALAAEEAVLLEKRGGSVVYSIDKETEIRAFLDQMANVIGKPVIYDPRNNRIARQQFGTSFRHSVPAPRFLDSCRALLGFYELVVVPVGPSGYEIYLVIDSRSSNNFVKNKAEQVAYEDLHAYADRDGVFISCAIPVRHIENLTTLRTALTSMSSPAGIGRVHEVPGSQSIIVTDFAPTVVAISRLITRMDVPTKSKEQVMEVIELRYAKSKELALALTELVAGWTKPADSATARGRYAGGPYNMPPRIIAYEARNALLIAAIEPDAVRIRNMIATLDQPKKEFATVETGYSPK